MATVATSTGVEEVIGVSVSGDPNVSITANFYDVTQDYHLIKNLADDRNMKTVQLADEAIQTTNQILSAAKSALTMLAILEDDAAKISVLTATLANIVKKCSGDHPCEEIKKFVKNESPTLREILENVPELQDIKHEIERSRSSEVKSPISDIAPRSDSDTPTVDTAPAVSPTVPSSHIAAPIVSPVHIVAKNGWDSIQKPKAAPIDPTVKRDKPRIADGPKKKVFHTANFTVDFNDPFKNWGPLPERTA